METENEIFGLLFFQTEFNYVNNSYDMPNLILKADIRNIIREHDGKGGGESIPKKGSFHTWH